MQKIVPHLWFDKEAVEAAEYYVNIFPGSKVSSIKVLENTPSGDASIVSFLLSGYEFMAISAGPLFKSNPAISFMLNFDPSKDKNAEQNLVKFWEKLSEKGEILMPLQKYDFSKKYGWCQDKFGVSWQLILSDPEGDERPFIVPSMLFVGQNCGKAEEAINFYKSVFAPNSKTGMLARYPKGSTQNKEGTLMFGDFALFGQWFAAMDSGFEHKFNFNESISYLVKCDSQQEIDSYWEKLSAVPEAEQCGWLKDKYGVSWQIVPRIMDEMMASGSTEQIASLTKAFLQMKKFDIAELEKAYKRKAGD